MSDWKNLTYHIVLDGKPAGPFSFDQLKDLKLNGHDFVKSQDMKEFKELNEIQGLSSQLGVSFEHTIPQYYATMDNRLLAFGIDYFIATAIYLIVSFVYLYGKADVQAQIPLLIAGLLLIPVIKFIMVVAAEGSAWQASIGKKLIGIRITTTKGATVSYAKVFLRNFAKILGFLSLGIGFILGFLDRKQQCWHDKIAGTLVIKSRLV